MLHWSLHWVKCPWNKVILVSSRAVTERGCALIWTPPPVWPCAIVPCDHTITHCSKPLFSSSSRNAAVLCNVLLLCFLLRPAEGAVHCTTLLPAFCTVYICLVCPMVTWIKSEKLSQARTGWFPKSTEMQSNSGLEIISCMFQLHLINAWCLSCL